MGYLLYSLWYVKIEMSQNHNLSTSLKMPHNELLNALFNFEIRHSKLKLWAIKERASKYQKCLCSMGYYIAFDMSKLTRLRIKI